MTKASRGPGASPAESPRTIPIASVSIMSGRRMGIDSVLEAVASMVP